MVFTLDVQNRKVLRNLLEGLLFASPDPVSLKEMERVTGGEEQEILSTLLELQRTYEERDGALCIRQVGRGWQMVIKPEYGELLRERLRLSGERTISRSALETLAVVSLYQPITKAEIDLKRGVDSTQALRSLLAMGLVTICGRSDAPGRPFLYRVSEKFFEVFGLEGEEALERLKRLFFEENYGKAQ